MSTQDEIEDVNSTSDADDTNDTGTEEVNTGTESGETTDDLDDIDDPNELREIARKTRETRDKNYKRLKEAQGFKWDKATKTWVKKEPSNNTQTTTESNNPQQEKKSDLTADDIFTLVEAKVPREDLETVKKFARLEGVTIQEALKDSTLKSILRERADERATANATNVDKTRRAPGKASTEALHQKASESGEVPDSDEDLRRLAESTLN